MSEFKDLIENEDHSEYYNILNALISGKKNIDLKSDIKKPQLLSILQAIGEYSENSLNLKKTAKTINNFINTYLRFMISYNRSSREEIVRALIGWAKKEKEDKEINLTEMLKKV
ncbi:MAG: hypothetical protein GF317_20010 [Candidatus Lokiarchaeota archaeon]|nr:hypothetical protein [Candidatus Lokiarchaeota archaeon]